MTDHEVSLVDCSRSYLESVMLRRLDSTSFALNAMFMETEAWRHASNYPFDGDRPRPPEMSDREVLNQYRRFQAVAWVQAADGGWHKVGLSHRGRLAFSHHTTKELRRHLAFRELGGAPCPCVHFLDLFLTGTVWTGWPGKPYGIPPTFRKAVASLLARHWERERGRKVRPRAGDRSDGRKAAYVGRGRSHTRISGRRTRYDQED